MCLCDCIVNKPSFVINSTLFGWDNTSHVTETWSIKKIWKWKRDITSTMWRSAKSPLEMCAVIYFVGPGVRRIFELWIVTGNCRFERAQFDQFVLNCARAKRPNRVHLRALNKSLNCHIARAQYDQNCAKLCVLIESLNGRFERTQYDQYVLNCTRSKSPTSCNLRALNKFIICYFERAQYCHFVLYCAH